jgi:polyphosphate kinase
MRPTPTRQRFSSIDESSPIGDETEPPEMLAAELSLLAFQRRVLAIAEDPRTPLRERLRFIGIVTSNLDEFHMVRIPELRQAAADRSGAAHQRGVEGVAYEAGSRAATGR